MKFALFNNTKIEATKGANGICPVCGSMLVAKCGEVKINHWSHKTSVNCDPWWENETTWHRSWKNNYPEQWQEKVMYDQLTGEIHIADVFTNHNLVIEFQHSHINPQERKSREKFYINMVWLVDGTRLKRDYQRFHKGRKDFRPTSMPNRFIVDFPDECFPKNWIDSAVPVIFDFNSEAFTHESGNVQKILLCLMPVQKNGSAILFQISAESFINNTINGAWFNPQTPQTPKPKPPPTKISIKTKEPTHYYDPRKGKMVKRWRF
jgi:hypothetical protein